MRRVREVIVVEGRYDKNTLSQVVDAVIVELGGFGIFSDHEKLELLRRLGKARGLILLTDPDGAGFLIRNYLKGALDPGWVKHAYVPDIKGRERRKTQPSKEGKLGVEGMSPELLLEALQRCGATFEDEVPELRRGSITKADLYALGLSGRPDAGEKRRRLLKKLDLPERLSPNALLDVLNALTDLTQLRSLLEEDP